jgi:CDP-diacylglycerol--serine O-phosphatidyltransferase
MARKPKPPKPPKVKRKRFDLHKALFVLPNAFTASSIFCGFLAIIMCLRTGPVDFHSASLAIFFGAMFDMFDGRVARLTKTQSEFGREFDSLADVITFGVAPGILVYKWALESMGQAGIFLAFSFTACGAIRLARFNVLAIRDPVGTSKYFTGLPIPLAAAALVSLIFANPQGSTDIVTHEMVAVLTVVLAFLMVSTVKYRTFKNLKLTRRSVGVMGMLLALVGYFSWTLKPAVVLMAFVWGYALVGMVEEVVFFRRRRLAALAAQVPQPAAPGASMAAPPAEPPTP